MMHTLQHFRPACQCKLPLKIALVHFKPCHIYLAAKYILPDTEVYRYQFIQLKPSTLK